MTKTSKSKNSNKAKNMAKNPRVPSDRENIAKLLARADKKYPPTQPNGFQFEAAKAVTDPRLRTMPASKAMTTKNLASGTVQGPASIVELARALNVDGNGPQLMYEWVYNNVEWEPGWGVYKGALGALLDGRGNAFDQSMLLAELLREAGYTANIVQGVIRLYEADYQAWWNVVDIWGAQAYCGNQYIPIFTVPTWTGSTWYMDIKHVWVEWDDGVNTYSFDPSYKQYDRTAGMSSGALASALGYNAGTFMSNAESGATIDGSGDFVQKMNRGNIRSDLDTFTMNLVDYIKNNAIGSASAGTATIDDILGGEKIVPAAIPLLQTSLPYQMPGDTPNVWTGAVPNSYRPTLQIQMVNQDNSSVIDFDYTAFSDDLAASRLTIWYDGSDVPSLYLNGSAVATGVAQDPFGWATWVVLTVVHPAYDASEYPISWQQWYQTTFQWNQGPIIPGSYYLIGNAWGNLGRGQLTYHQKQLAAAEAAGGAATDESVLGEKLSCAFQSWAAQNSKVVDIENRLRVCHTMYNHQVGLVSFNIFGYNALSVDLGGVSGSSTNFNNDVTQTPPNDRVIAMHGVALEAAVCAQMTELTPGISTTTVVDQACRTVRATIGGTVTVSDVLALTAHDAALAGGSESVTYTVQSGDTLSDIADGLAAAVNGNTNLSDARITATSSGVEVVLATQSMNETTYSKTTSGGATETITLSYDKIYKGTSANWATGTNVQSILVGNGYDAGDMANINGWLTWGNRAVLADHPGQVLGDWSGWGDWIYPDAGAYGFILGGYKGGASQQGMIDNGGATDNSNPGNSPDGQPQDGDPIGMFTGDFFYKRQDMTVGSGAYPYQLSFHRFYNSASQYANGPLGRGWSHNWQITAKKASDGFLAMGQQSALQAAASIAEFFVANDIASDTTFSISKLVTMCLADRWWTDQIVGNSVVIASSTKTRVFTRLPDGSYVQPLSNADKLSVDNGLYVLTTAQQIVQSFNSDGNLETIEFPNGVIITLTYSSGKPQTISNGLGRTLTLSYTGDYIDSVSDGNGRSVSYTIDGSANLTTFENTLADTWTYVYDQPGRMTQYFLPTYPLVAFNTNEYDSLSRVKTQTNARNQTWEYHFAGSRSEEIDPLGNARTRYFNEFGGVIRSIDPLGHETVSEYDGFNRPINVTLPEGNQVQWTYDLSNNVLTTTKVPKPGSLLSSITTTSTYDPTFNKADSYEDGNSNVWSMTYDPVTGDLLSIVKPMVGGLNPSSQMTWNSRGQPVSIIDETGVQTQFLYDNSTETLLSIIANTNWTAAIGGTATIGNSVTLTAHDSGLVGGQKSKSYAVVSGDTLSDIADGLAAAINSDSDLSDLGIVAYANGSSFSISTSPGNLTTFTTSTSGGATVSIAVNSGLELTTSMGYNAVGDVDSVTTPNGDETLLFFDAERRMIQKEDPSPFGYLTNLAYDEVGNLLSIQRQKDAVPSWQTYTFTYSETNERLTAVDPLNNTTVWTYDAKDRLESVTDAESRETSYSYDELDRIYEITDPSSTVCDTRTYTDNGRLGSVMDARGNITTYSYDDHDRLDSTTYADSTFEQNYSYDDNGNVLGALTRSGNNVTKSFDALNRCITKSPQGQPTISYVYDLADRLIQMSKPVVVGDPSSGDLHYFFDTAGRLTQEKYPDGKTVTHELDGNGNRTKTTWPDGYFIERTYDELNRLTDIELNGAGTSAIHYDYDYLSRQTVLTYGNGAVVDYGFEDNNDMSSLGQTYNGSISVLYTYNYNAVREETSRNVDDGSYMWHPGSSGTTTYGTADSVNAYPAVGGSTFTYDGNKNVTGDGVWTYTYDTENHLLSASKTGVSASFVYEPNHRQSQKVVGSIKTRYIYSGWQRIADYDGTTGSLQNRHIYGNGLDEVLVTVSAAGVLTYLHHDKLGSIIATSNSLGAVTNVNAYGHFGEISSHAGTTFGFTGQRYDSELGLYYFRHRYMSPQLGRFLQPDPLGYTSTDFNLYSYGSNSPLKYIDPFGLSSYENAQNMKMLRGYFDVDTLLRPVPQPDDPAFFVSTGQLQEERYTVTLNASIALVALLIAGLIALFILLKWLVDDFNARWLQRENDIKRVNGLMAMNSAQQDDINKAWDRGFAGYFYKEKYYYFDTRPPTPWEPKDHMRADGVVMPIWVYPEEIPLIKFPR